MKKALIAVAIAFLVIGAAAAQPYGQWNQPRNATPGFGQQTMPAYGRGMMNNYQSTVVLEKITLEGTLQLVDGRVAIKKDSKTYFVMIPSRLYGFVDGLKEGASVKVDGDSHAVPGVENSYAVRVSTLTLNGKAIDLSTTAGTFGGRGSMGGGMMGGGMRGNAPRGGGMGWKR